MRRRPRQLLRCLQARGSARPSSGIDTKFDDSDRFYPVTVAFLGSHWMILSPALAPEPLTDPRT